MRSVLIRLPNSSRMRSSLPHSTAPRSPEGGGTWRSVVLKTSPMSEAVTVVIGGRDHAFLITELEFGRP